jgi:hypothetical protein
MITLNFSRILIFSFFRLFFSMRSVVTSVKQTFKKAIQQSFPNIDGKKYDFASSGLFLFLRVLH